MTTPEPLCLQATGHHDVAPCPVPDCAARIRKVGMIGGAMFATFDGDCLKYPTEPTTPQEHPVTNASFSTVTTVEHHFTFPTHPRGDMSDLGVAMSWARDKAKELDIDTSFDDWAEIHADEESVTIVVKDTKKTSP